MPAAAGARFGRYELVSPLGAGGMGEVFRARDHDLHREVAVKFLPARFAADATRLARFAQEARAASSLNHPNIVTIHEVGEAFGQPFIVMELVDGVTLRHAVSHGPIPPKRAIEYAAQVAEGLAKAHAAGIVHRDLKPENVMVSRDGFVKVLDFGLAKLRSDGDGRGGGGRAASSDEDVTRETPETDLGAVLGTVGYMSPEQAAGQPAGFQSDQFSLGVILYEMASGKRPFARKTSVQTLAAIIESDPEPLQDANPAFPLPACWIVDRCLAKNPADRYASTVDLAHELRDVRSHLTDLTTPSDSRPRHPMAVRRRATAGVAAAVGLVAVVLGLFAVPSINDAVRARLGWLPLPGEKRVAVLPASCRGGSDNERQACEGLPEFLVTRLGELPRFQRGLDVVPASEVRQNGVTTAAAARGRLGATLAVHVTAERQGARVLLGVSLIDTRRLRQVRAATRNIAAANASLLDEAVRSVVSMLDLELEPDAEAALRAGGTSLAEASTLYAQGLQAQPAQSAVAGLSALERYDQQPSLEQAVALFAKAVELDPRYALAHAGLGEAHRRLYRLTRQPEHLELAEEHCRRALALDALVPQVWQTLGNLHVETGKAEEALSDFAKAIARNPRNAEVYRDLASAYSSLNRQKEAEAAYQQAIRLPSPSWSIFSYYGAFLMRRQRYAEAEAAFRQGLQLAPENARLWSLVGVAQYSQERLDEADAAFERSLAIFPSGIAASNSGTLRFDRGDYSGAARSFEKATSLSPRDYRIWRNLGAAYFWAPGERDRAAAAYRTALELGEQERRIVPASGALAIDLADCTAMLGDKAKAAALVEEGLRLAPGDAEAQYRAADVYETLGNRGEALRLLGLALRAGRHRVDLERSPSFARLRADPRYAKLIDGLARAAEGPAR